VQDPYAVLGVGAQSSPEAVRAAWLALVKALHPDRLTAATTGDRARAERRLSDVNAAYAAVRADWHQPPAWPTGPASFVVQADPPLVFEALVLAAGDLGEVTDTDEPFSFVIHVEGPPTGYCWVGLFGEAGDSLVVVESDQVDPSWVGALLADAVGS
jgi:hypothetical protein